MTFSDIQYKLLPAISKRNSYQWQLLHNLWRSD